MTKTDIFLGTQMFLGCRTLFATYRFTWRKDKYPFLVMLFFAPLLFFMAFIGDLLLFREDRHKKLSRADRAILDGKAPVRTLKSKQK